MHEDAPALLIDRELPDYDEAMLRQRGKLPSWLRGTLVRTAAASFREGNWRAQHLFDALAALYAFEIREDGSIVYRQRMLDSMLRRRLREGLDDTPHFYTGMRRSLLARALSPIPRPNDNTNVNVLPLGGALVAMTETTLQHEIDPQSLASRGHVAYEDDHRQLFMLAHPQLDRERGLLINVATRLGRRSGLVLYQQVLGAHRRQLLAEIPLQSVPYLHSFGLTPRYALLYAGPLLLEPWRLLWSERGYIRHFRYRPERGSVIYRVERATGAVQTYRAPAGFVFHVMNAFERSDELVLDVLAYDDARIIETLTIDALRRSFPALHAHPQRIVLREGEEDARVSPLADETFEFPTLHEARALGRPYRRVWGARGSDEGTGYRGGIVRLDLEGESLRRFEEPGYLLGEPLFVPSPDARTEGDGVLLSVGTHVSGTRSALAVLDAETLDVRAWGELDRLLPLSFHGCFRTARA